MPFRRQGSIRPVQSRKHIVDVASSVVVAVATSIPVVIAVDSGPNLGNPADVKTGCTVNAIYLRAEVLATGVYAGVPRVYMLVFKNPGNNLAAPNPNGAGISDNKRYVIHQEMIMVTEPGASTSSLPRTLFQGVIKIPPRLKRFGYNDRLAVQFQNGSGETTGISNVCVQCIYKEYN